MKKFILLSIVSFITYQANAQHSSMDIRHADGGGPYPVYFAAGLSYALNKQLFEEFTKPYSESDLHKMEYKSLLHGFEGNLGIVLNDKNFLGIKNWLVRGFAVEVGYRYLFRNINDKDPKTIRLHYQEEAISLRLCKRGNIAYPLTWQIQTGPMIYNFYSAAEHNKSALDTSRVREGTGLFERTPHLNRVISGWDLRGRLMFFDPAGTSGGVGFYVEFRHVWAFGQHDLNSLFETFLHYPQSNKRDWNYGSFAIGMIVPLAIRMVSSE